ncbi:MAG: hypothetical protein EVA75_00770 [Candidatus Pelagibacterales bacterium]|nr:MAG: hypothetical protein EVA75_00770 [Pelagibacterales bacterium]|tara:strand:+ start:1857 stop:2444 length:588 start_codon:yes stop_codon:yes gene_type:complete
MKKRYIIQVFLISSIFILIFFTYFSSTEKKIEKKKITQNKTIISNKDEKDARNVIENANFVTRGNSGVLFEIKSDTAKTFSENPEISHMTNVLAVITLLNGEKIFIKSDNARFNQLNSNSFFEGNIKIDYSENKILCENLDIKFMDNLIVLYNNIEFTDLEKIIYADQMNINLVNRQAKVFMFDENKKVKTIIKN